MADSALLETEAEAVRSWAASKKISIEAINCVIEHGFSSMEALECLGEEDLKALPKRQVPIGQQKLLLRALSAIKSVDKCVSDTAPSVVDNGLAANAVNNADAGNDGIADVNVNRSPFLEAMGGSQDGLVEAISW